MMANCCTDCHEADITVSCDDSFGRCKDCATEANFCWCCGREGELCFDSDEYPMPEEWSGACRHCCTCWHDTLETDRMNTPC